MSKTGNANAKAAACNYGATCRKYGCNYAHPKARKGDCRFGDRCHKDGCKFLHPKGHTPGDSTTYPVARTGGKNAGGGSKSFRSVSHLRPHLRFSLFAFDLSMGRQSSTTFV